MGEETCVEKKYCKQRCALLDPGIYLQMEKQSTSTPFIDQAHPCGTGTTFNLSGNNVSVGLLRQRTST